jgi:hypothetical protein
MEGKRDHLVKFSTDGSAGVGQVLLTVNAKFLDIHCPKPEQNNGVGN